MQAASTFVEGVSQIAGLEVCGQPDMCVVAIKSTEKSLNIYKVNDLMTQKGWHLNALQFPSSVHMCFTAQHVNVVSELLQVWLIASSCSHPESAKLLLLLQNDCCPVLSECQLVHASIASMFAELCK